MRLYIHLTLTDAFRLVFVKVNYVRLIFLFYFCAKLFDSYSGKMSDDVKLKNRRAYVRGTITSTLNQLTLYRLSDVENVSRDCHPYAQAMSKTSLGKTLF